MTIKVWGKRRPQLEKKKKSIIFTYQYASLSIFSLTQAHTIRTSTDLSRWKPINETKRLDHWIADSAAGNRSIPLLIIKSTLIPAWALVLISLAFGKLPNPTNEIEPVKSLKLRSMLWTKHGMSHHVAATTSRSSSSSS
jgi:hypothetical protein